jgi:hypothetical protein
MTGLLWVVLPILVAVGSGVLVYFVMQARLEAAIAKEREALSQARGMLEAQKQTMEETKRATEESARRKALDDFLADMRVEERHYVREHKLLFMHRKSLVVQERIFFRNIPLCNWVEHEMMLDEGADIDRLAKSLSIFEAPALEEAPRRPRKLLG